MLAIASCRMMPLVAPSGSAIALIPTTNVLQVNGSTEIVAVVVEGALQSSDVNGVTIVGGGTPVHNGTVVTFTTTLGRIEPSEAKTTGGRATVRLVADHRSGVALVTAFSGAIAQSIAITIGAAGAERLAVTANPQALPSIGGTAVISARVEEGTGNGISGVPVSFSTTRGTVTPAVSVSDGNGVATTVLSTTQEATVTANVGGASWDLAGSVTVTIRPSTAVTITPPVNARVGVPAPFVITPAANSVLSNVIVDFGDGQSVSLGAITGATPVLHVFGAPGIATVTATSTDSLGDTATVSVQVAVLP